MASRDRGAVGSLRALAVANARYWPTVAPATRRELKRWAGPAGAIEDPELRALALGKLSEERFNAEVAATLATLAPARTRGETVTAIVALELLFDYLDGRTERPSADPLSDGIRLFVPFLGAVTPGGAGVEETSEAGAHPADWAYLTALSGVTRERLLVLPAAAAVSDRAQRAAARCAQAQTRIHAAASLGDAQLRDWADRESAGTGLGWREYTSGCASSVLAMHALIAAAADPATTIEDAARIDAAYLAIGAVITILDSLVDEAEDASRGERGFIRLFDVRELPAVLRALIREALERSREAPHADHHAMTLAGVAAYYTTHPGAREPAARDVAAVVRRELSPTIWPTLAVMSLWRAAKRVRARNVPGSTNTAERASDTVLRGQN
jgi:tetraprenyl-beta-curcumene synthase